MSDTVRAADLTLGGDRIADVLPPRGVNRLFDSIAWTTGLLEKGLTRERERESLELARITVPLLGDTIMFTRSRFISMILVGSLALSLCQRAQSGGTCFKLIKGLPCCSYTVGIAPCIEGCNAPGGGPCCNIPVVDPTTNIMQPGTPGWLLRAWTACPTAPSCTLTPATCPGGACSWPGPNINVSCTCHVAPGAATDC